MFDHLRADLLAQLTDAQASVQRAAAARDAAQANADLLAGQLQPLRDALSRAQTNAQNANAALASAQALVEQRQQTRDRAQSDRDGAQTALGEHADNEPEETLPNGHPNPAWLTWKREEDRLKAALANAQSALDTANAALTQAQQAHDAAALAANAATADATKAQNQLSSITTALGAAQERVATEDAELNDAERATALLSARISGLDARAARIRAEPFNRADLEQAADAELADLLAHRHSRHDLLSQRADLIATRGALLAAQDTTVDNLGALRAKISGWPDTGRYPMLAGIAAALDAVVIASQTERKKPPAQRNDDLAQARAIVATQLDALQAAVQQASGEREKASAALAQAIQALGDHEAAQL